MLPSELKVAQNTSPSPANEVTPMSYDGGQTVVISSTGVEFVGAQASFAPRQITPAADRSSRPVPLSSLPAGGRIRVATIIFSHGSTHLSDRDRQILREVRAVQQSRGGRLVVVGHASSRTRSMDTVRHKMVNYRVSAARADAVAAALTSLGIPRDSIQIDARSDSEPVFYEVMPTGEAGNRRAEVYLES